MTQPVDEPDHEPPPALLDKDDDPHEGQEVWFPLEVPDGE